MYDHLINKTVFVNIDQGNIKGTLDRYTKKYLVLLVFETGTEELFEYIIDRKKINYIATSATQAIKSTDSDSLKRKEKSKS